MKFTSTALLCALFGTAAVTNANHISMQPTSRDAAMEAFSSDAVRSRSGQAKVRSYQIDLKLGGQTFQEISAQRSMNGLLESGFETMTFELPHTQAVSFTVAKSGVAKHHYVGTSTVDGSLTDAYLMVDEATGHFSGSMSHEDGSIYSVLTRPDGSTWVSFIPADERLEEQHMHVPDDALGEFDDSRIHDERRPGDDETIVGESGYAPRDDPGVIDVMVAYTKEAMCEAAGVSLSSCSYPTHKSTIEGQINLAVANNNVAHVNSNTGTSLNLVYQYMESYTESGSLSTDLSRIRTKNDGYMESAHSNRDTYKADIVALITANGSGVGYVGASKGYMFSVTNWGYIPGHTFAHELGHNWGCYHNRDDSNTQAAYAHGWQSPDKTFRTILAYPCDGANCPRVNWYSSSDTSITYQNKAIGDATNDCARKIRERRQTVTDFYQGGNSVPVTPTPPAPAPVPAPVPAPGTCTDIPFTDSYGDSCSWYNSESRCDTWGDCCNIGQGTASDNCCMCGGGSSSGGGGGGGGSTCTDDANFVDSYGDNCSWYNSESRCDTWGDCCNIGKGTANQKCCMCGGSA